MHLFASVPLPPNERAFQNATVKFAVNGSLLGKLLCFVGLHDWRRMDEQVSPFCAHKRLVCQRCLEYLYAPTD